MQYEISTAEAVEIFSVTRKTIAVWARVGIMEKISHGRYDLKKSLKNFISYQECVHQGYDNPLDTWMVRQEVTWAEENPLPRYDPESFELVDIDELVPQRVTVERDGAGRIVRVVGEAKG
jgi:hypothetical protein